MPDPYSPRYLTETNGSDLLSDSANLNIWDEIKCGSSVSVRYLGGHGFKNAQQTIYRTVISMQTSPTNFSDINCEFATFSFPKPYQNRFLQILKSVRENHEIEKSSCSHLNSIPILIIYSNRFFCFFCLDLNSWKLVRCFDLLCYSSDRRNMGPDRVL